MMRKTWGGLRDFWRTDRGLSVFLGLLLVLVLAASPGGPPSGGRSLVVDLIFALLLFTGVASVSVGPRTRFLLAAAAVTAVALRLGPSPTNGALEVSTLLSLGLLAIVILAQTFRAGPVTVHRILGAVAAYLLLGLAWASAYEFCALFAPGAFAGNDRLADDPRGWIYFSFVTLTTVGYGDVTPLNGVARSLAILEALTGQLYPAILLARIVSLEVQTRPSD